MLPRPLLVHAAAGAGDHARERVPQGRLQDIAGAEACPEQRRFRRREDPLSGSLPPPAAAAR
jgi:hypothetical protein